MKFLKMLFLGFISFCALNVQAMERAKSLIKAGQEGSYLKQLPSELKQELAEFMVEPPQVQNSNFTTYKIMSWGNLSQYTKGGTPPYTYVVHSIKNGRVTALNSDGSFAVQVLGPTAELIYSVRDAKGRMSKPATVTFYREMMHGF